MVMSSKPLRAKWLVALGIGLLLSACALKASPQSEPSAKPAQPPTEVKEYWQH
jgi:hypothetical protein